MFADGDEQLVEGARDVLELFVAIACGWNGTSDNGA